MDKADSHGSKLARNALESWTMAVLVVVPLFTNAYSVFPFEESKAPLLRAAAAMALPLFIYLAAAPGRLWRRPLVVPALLTGYTCLAATAFSVDPAGSFLGLVFRRQGTFTFFGYLFFFLAVILAIRRRSQVERLVFTVVLTAMAVSFWAVLQKLGLDSNPAGTAAFGGRVWGTLGNPIFVSGLLILAIPLNIYVLRWAWPGCLAGSDLAGPGPGPGRRMGRWAARSYFLLMLAFLGLELAALVLARSRGPLLGLAGGLFFFLVITLLRLNRRRAAGLVLATALVLPLVLASIFTGPVGWGGLSPVRERLGQAFETGTGQVRLHIWKGVAALVRAEPLRALVGYGPESLYLVLPQYNSPLLKQIEAPASVADRAHNEMLDHLVMEGALGLLAYVLFFGAACRYGLRRLGLINSTSDDQAFILLFTVGGLWGVAAPGLGTSSLAFSGLGLGLGLVGGAGLYLVYATLRPSRGPVINVPGREAWLLTALLSALIGHFIEVQFSFGQTSTRLYYWVLAGLLVAVGEPGPDRDEEAGRGTRLNQATVGAAGPVVLVICTCFFDFSWMAKINPGAIFAMAGLGLTAVLAGGLFGRLRSVEDHQSRPGFNLAVFLTLVALSIGLYMLSFTYLDKYLAQLLQPHLMNSIVSVLEKNIKLASFYGWVTLFVFLDAVLSFRGWGGPGDSGRPSRAVWWFPLSVLLALPMVIVPNLTSPMADTYTKAGDELAGLKKWQVAELCYRRALDYEPSEHWRHARLGQFFYARGLAAEGEERDGYLEQGMFNLDQAQHLAPRDVHTVNNLARIGLVWAAGATEASVRRHRLQLADKFYTRAIMVDRNNSYLWQDWGKIAADLGEGEIALRRFQQAVRLLPEDFEARQSLAKMLFRQGLYRAALFQAHQARRLAPDESHGGLDGLIQVIQGRMKPGPRAD
jgi:tetratricopeptide (TPR) repeat protein